MDKEVIKNLEKNNYLKEKISIIEELIEKKELKEAYLKFTYILDYINIKYIKVKYNIDMAESTIMKISKFYRKKDPKLEDYMKIINAEYNDVNLDDLGIEDVEYVASIIDLIYEYMVKDIGNFIYRYRIGHKCIDN